MQPFRKSNPKRTCDRTYANYRAYKDPLRDDFNKRCGYCDDEDTFCGGPHGYHIDHFRPQHRFKHLENSYANLVYACPYCNGGKRHDWPSDNEELCVINDRGYIDPCDVEYEALFERYDNGRIRPKTEVAKYMFKKLKLGLRRHQLAWSYACLAELAQELLLYLTDLEEADPLQIKLHNHHRRLMIVFWEHKKMFEETL